MSYCLEPVALHAVAAALKSLGEGAAPTWWISNTFCSGLGLKAYFVAYGSMLRVVHNVPYMIPQIQRLSNSIIHHPERRENLCTKEKVKENVISPFSLVIGVSLVMQLALKIHIPGERNRSMLCHPHLALTNGDSSLMSAEFLLLVKEIVGMIYTGIYISL